MGRDDIGDVSGERLRLLGGERRKRLFKGSGRRDGTNGVDVAIDDDPTGAENDHARAQAFDVLDDVRAVKDRATSLREDPNEMAEYQNRSDVETRFRLVEDEQLGIVQQRGNQ